jgi:hypothetical protein
MHGPANVSLLQSEVANRGSVAKLYVSMETF